MQAWLQIKSILQAYHVDKLENTSADGVGRDTPGCVRAMLKEPAHCLPSRQYTLACLAVCPCLTRTVMHWGARNAAAKLGGASCNISSYDQLAVSTCRVASH